MNQNSAAEFHIRSANAEDIPLVLAFIRELAEYERLSHLVSAGEAQLRESLFGAQPGAEILLGFAGDTPAGFAVYFHNFSTFLGVKGLWLEDLYVRPALRRRGYGRALLLHVARIARERGCGRFEWAALDWNEPAIRFYKSMGAVALDDWTTFRVTGPALGKLADIR
ncbi:MAG TPA: GNAT family N-acetyltransferase [Burkholderiales bacterium]|jgi:GNAT superfamily N-acetyltransferase|nr:GNAT family N-acetyltransferase [Burkholderiales bacterium]